MKPNCKICGKQKEEKYKKLSYCKECTIENTRKTRLMNPGYSKRDWQLRKKRIPKNEFCTKCGLEKEPKWRHTSYCSKCANARARIWELNNKDKVKASQEKKRIERQSTKCEECSKIFIRQRGEKYCSIRCKLLGEKTINENGCWISPLTSSRCYGQISLHGIKNKAAHRLAYEEFKGVIPDGMYVCHKCDVPACCNPEHLFLGTPGENVHDGIKKGRIKHVGAKGIDCKFTNLTDEQIEEMRKMYKEGFDYARLSRIFKCSREYASKIVRYKVRK